MSTLDHIKKVKENTKVYLTIEHSNAKKFACQCGTILVRETALKEKGHCPLCGDDVLAFETDVSLNEKRYNCPRCRSSFKFESCDDKCPICSAYMDVYAETTRPKNNSKVIPIGTE